MPATQEFMALLLHVLLTPAVSPFADFDTLLLKGFVVIQHVSPAHPGAKAAACSSFGIYLCWFSINAQHNELLIISGGSPNVPSLMMAASASLSTAPLHGYQVIFSPYTPHKLTFTGAHNYGIAGENICMYKGCQLLRHQATLSAFNILHTEKHARLKSIIFYWLWLESRHWHSKITLGEPAAHMFVWGPFTHGH